MERQTKRQKKAFDREAWEKSRGPLTPYNITGKQVPVINNRFKQYYEAQKIVPPEEWDLFIEYLTRELPTTFRINTIGGYHEIIKEVLESVFVSSPDIVSIKLSEMVLKIDPPQPIPWYFPGNNLAWHYTINRRGLRKTPILKQLKHFLALENEVGRVSHQEAVSMMPTLLLDIKPHHSVLDMCAAPGSKTQQILELLHYQMDSPWNTPSGFVIANDADITRSYLLTHQLQRLGSPCYIVTNYLAQAFPNLPIRTSDGVSDLKFDRILCDVPCSGDGTLRKSPHLAKQWHTRSGLGIHGDQVPIALRAVQLLKVGGIMVYSTCSLNPLEDEAVVAHMLKKYQGKIRLVDITDKTKLMNAQPGITTWKVLGPTAKVSENQPLQWDDENFKEYTKLEDLTHAERGLIRKTMFPPTPEEQNELHLERCIRLLPHRQDTGGFFIAVIKN